MPWHVEHHGGTCGPDKPWAVIKDTDGSTVACHVSQAKAKAHARALYANAGRTVDPTDSLVTREFIRRKTY